MFFIRSPVDGGVGDDDFGLPRGVLDGTVGDFIVRPDEHDSTARQQQKRDEEEKRARPGKVPHCQAADGKVWRWMVHGV